ncbi:MAG: hypothetical protein WA902_03605 [Thermosynechococcaceae cyanobacterium]
MAKLPDSLLSTIFELLQRLSLGIEAAAATEWSLYQGYGERTETLEELEELQNARERLVAPYTRLNTLLLRILESQPKADPAMLELLNQTIKQAQASVDASWASVQEVKRVWRL